MKKFVIFMAIAVALIYSFKWFVQSGQFEKFLDANPNNSLNPCVEYCWGMLLNLADHKDSALYRLSRVVSKYPKSTFAPDAWSEKIEILDDMGLKNRVMEEAKSFMQSDYASTPKAEVIKRKISIIEHGL